MVAKKHPGDCFNADPELSAYQVEMLGKNPIRSKACTCPLVVAAFLPFLFGLSFPMAAYAVVHVANAFLQVLHSHATWLVLVT